MNQTTSISDALYQNLHVCTCTLAHATMEDEDSYGHGTCASFPTWDSELLVSATQETAHFGFRIARNRWLQAPALYHNVLSMTSGLPSGMGRTWLTFPAGILCAL